MRRFKMHNCKSTQSSFIDLAFDEIPPARTTQLLAELNDCPACREEYAAVRSTLHRSDQALKASSPGEEFWSGYHARLNAKLLNSSLSEPPALAGGQDLNQTIGHPLTQVVLTTPNPLTQVVLTRFGSVWRSVMKTASGSVRVPVPVALGLVLLLGASVFFLRPRGAVNAALPTQSPIVETRTINVPVIQEKVITRVVYLEKKGRRSRSAVNDGSQPSGLSDSVARARSDARVGAPLSLVDFKPTDQINLTITKGSNRDEK